MDIEKFDRRYPTPAHAAAAERLGRTMPRYRDTEPRHLLKDRSGTIIVTAALSASLLGGLGFVWKANGDRTFNPSVESRMTVPTARIVSQPIPSTIKLAPPPVAKAAPARRVVPVDQGKPSVGVAKPVDHPARSSGWILDPLSGDALTAALIVDKRRTVELNAEQLRLMAEDRAKTAAAAQPVPDALPQS